MDRLDILTSNQRLKIEDLDNHVIIELLQCYDNYIQNANDNQRYSEGWYPVCVEEYLNNEYVEYLEQLSGTRMIVR